MTLAVGAFVFDDRERVLLIQRGKEPAIGRWTIPGGKVELGETHELAVAREILEETNLVVEVGAFVATIEIGPYEIHDYLAFAIGGELRAGSDALDARFCDDADLARLPLTDGLLPVLAAARAVLHSRRGAPADREA